MPQPVVCPDVMQYQQLATGQLADADEEALLEHLEQCDSCAQKLTARADQDTLVELIRRDKGRGHGAPDGVLGRLVECLSKLRPDQASAAAEQPPLAPDAVSVASLPFSCPGCGKSFLVKGEWVGKQVRCPHCQQGVRVPVAATPPKKFEPAMVPPSAVRSVSSEPRSRLNASTVDGARVLSGTRDPGAKPPPPAGDKNEEPYAFLAPPQAPDELGRLGPYRVLAVLGAGGMGVVFRAEDPQLARLVALKAMLPALAASASARQRFLREARAAAAIKHDHIVTIHQVGDDRGVPFLAMEFLEGEPLDVRLQREGKLPAGEVLRIGREVALGLAAAHKRELIHRDIKPANLWLEAETGRVKILDFGLARAVGAEGQVTLQGAIIGTPAYMAPEQGQGKSLDARCDLFSLGCVLYRMATGEAAFHGTDMVSTLMAVATATPRPPRELEGAVPPALSDLIMSLLAKAPADRPPSAQAVAVALQDIAREESHRPASAVPPHRPASGQPATKTKRRLLAAVAICLLSIVVLGLWAAGVLRVQTKDGTIVLENVPADTEVLVDGNKVKLKLAGGGKLIEIQATPGKRKLEIKAAGFKMETQDVTLASGERKPIRIRLEPLAAVPEKPATPVRSTTEEKGFVPLFNGKDLTGWFVERDDPKSWGVEQGVIVARGSSLDRLNFLLSDRDYGDFVLRLEFNLSDHAGSGVILRAVPGEILPHHNGQRTSEHPVFRLEDQPTRSEVTGTLHWLLDRTHVGPLRAAELSPPGSWNKMEIELKGRSLRASVNGKLVVDTALAEGVLFKDGTVPGLNRLKGRIGMYKGYGTARFRNIEIRELTRAKTEIEQPSKFTSIPGMDFVRVPKGTFWVGGGSLEGPPTRQVEIKHDFELAKYPVTQEQWQAVMGYSPSQFSRPWVYPEKDKNISDTDLKLRLLHPNASHYQEQLRFISDADLKRFPVENVSWEDVQRFLTKLNEREKGKGWLYCAPTEAEWEYACRGAATSKAECSFDFYFAQPTNVVSRKQANFATNNPGEPGAEGPRLGRPEKVGSYAPNKLGLYDMHGNVYQWCDGMAGAFRVFRGGCWDYDSSRCRAAHRNWRGPAYRNSIVGFRVARVPVATKTEDAPPKKTGTDPVKLAPLSPRTDSIVRKFQPFLHPPGDETRKVGSVALSADNHLVLASGMDDGTAILWESASGKILQTFRTFNHNWITIATLSGDGKYVVTASGLNAAILWDAASGQKLQTFEGHTGRVLNVALSGDGKRVLTGSFDNTAILWDAASGKKLQTFEGHTGAINGVALSADSTLVLTGSCDSTAILWDATSGKKLQTYRGSRFDAGHQGRPDSVALSGDGKFVLIGFRDNTAILWDAASGQKLQIFAGHTERVQSVALSGDGKRVLTGSFDKTAILWDAASGKKIQTFKGHTGRILSVFLSADGKRILTGSTDQTAILWEVKAALNTPPPPAKELETWRRDRIPPQGLAAAGDGDPKWAPASLVAVLGQARPLHMTRASNLAFRRDGCWLAFWKDVNGGYTIAPRRIGYYSGAKDPHTQARRASEEMPRLRVGLV